MKVFWVKLGQVCAHPSVNVGGQEETSHPMVQGCVGKGMLRWGSPGISSRGGRMDMGPCDPPEPLAGVTMCSPLGAGGQVGERHHPHEVPGVAPLRLLHAARGRQPPPDSGHPGGETLRHRGEHGPQHRGLCAQHRALPQADQLLPEVSRDMELGNFGHHSLGTWCPGCSEYLWLVQPVFPGVFSVVMASWIPTPSCAAKVFA